MIMTNIGKYLMKEYSSIDLNAIKSIVFVAVKRYNNHRWMNKYTFMIYLKF